MKRLNGQPVVEVMLCVTFAISIEDAERIVAASTEEMQRISLDAYLRSHCPDDPMVSNSYSSGFGTFYTAYGKALADKRAQELKMLSAPAPVPHPEDVENL